MDGFDRLVRSLSPAELSDCAEGLLRLLGSVSAPKVAADAPAEAVVGTAAQSSGPAADTPEQRKSAAMTAAEKLAALLFPGNGETESSFAAVSGTEAGDARIKSGEAVLETALPAEAEKTGGSTEVLRPADRLYRRYEYAEGTRSFEMSRVSDWFRRDSRRYDSGFERY